MSTVVPFVAEKIKYIDGGNTGDIPLQKVQVGPTGIQQTCSPWVKRFL